MTEETLADVNPGSRLLLWTLLLALAGLVTWSRWAELDKITRTQGQVIVSSRNQVVQSPDGGVLEHMWVAEGDTVKRGQPLFRFEQARARASFQDSAGKVAGLRAAVARLQAEVFETPPRFVGLEDFSELRANQEALLRRRQAAIREDIRSLEESLRLVQSELDLNLPLVEQGDVSRAEVIKLQRQVADIKAQITNRRNKYFQDAQAELAKAQEELESAQQMLAQRQEQMSYTEITSPMDGIVRNVRLTTRGGVARPGDEILQIVPLEEGLIVETKVRPADIAFIKPGLPATVKLDAYDYAIYGSLQGEVSFISPDTLTEGNRDDAQPFYRVQVKIVERNLSSRNGQALEIQPGMTVVAEIRTGQHTVWDYLTKPITKTLGESLQER